MLATAGEGTLSALRHRGKAFSLDEGAQRNAMLGGLAALGFLVLFVPYNRKTRRMVEKLLTTETRRRGEG